MSCNTCHPHPPIDGAFGYSELWVAVNTLLYAAREALEKHAKQDDPTTEKPGTVTKIPEIVPNYEDANALKFVAEDGAFGLEKGPFGALFTGSSDYMEQHYAALLRYRVTDQFKIDLGWIHVGAGSSAEDVFGFDIVGTTTQIPGPFIKGWSEQTGPGQTTHYPDSWGDSMSEQNDSDSFFITGSYSF